MYEILSQHEYGSIWHKEHEAMETWRHGNKIGIKASHFDCVNMYNIYVQKIGTNIKTR